MHARAVSPAQPPLEAARAVIRELLGLLPPPALAAFTLQLLDERLALPAAPNGSAALPLQAEQPPLSAPPRRKPGRTAGPRTRRAKASGRTGSKAGRPLAEPAQDTEAPLANGDSREQHLATALTAAKELAAEFWTKADALDGASWGLVARTFNVLPALAQDARRHHELPRGVSVQQARAWVAAEA